MDKKVFLFDREPEDLERAKNALEADGYIVTTVSSFDEAKELFHKREKDFDIFILEIDHGGFALFRYIRSKNKYVSMMVRSNCNNPVIMGILINDGIDGYVYKEESDKEFITHVNRIVNV
jgi:DNA-binding response OmpR family regulator